MSDLTQAEQYIQSKAWKDFPAQELWIKNDKYFKAYELKRLLYGDYLLSETEGTYEDGKIVYQSSSKMEKIGNENRYLELLCRRIGREGYHCFASQLMV